MMGAHSSIWSGGYRFRLAVAFIAGVVWSGSASAQRPNGIDVSQFQGLINWSEVYAGGYVFAFVRAAHGYLPDTSFTGNITAARNAGLYAGAYHFAVPVDQQYGNQYLFGEDPVTDANYFLAAARNYVTAGYLRPVLDLELGGGQTPVGAPDLATWAIAWLNHVEYETGVRPMVYCSSHYASAYLSCSVTAYPLWIANWGPYNPQTGNPPIGVWNTCFPPQGWRFWQWTSSGNTSGYPSVPGINARVDLNVFNGTVDGLQEFVIGTPAVISLSPLALARTTRQYVAPEPQSFTVANIGAGPMPYQISTSHPWISVTPSSGTSREEPHTITVSYPTGSLAAGTYHAAITISSVQASNSPQGIPLTMTITPVPGDMDGDGDLDGDDFSLFYACMTGPNLGPPASGCEAADLDQDNDVDQSDFAILQRCYSGTFIPADPNCAD